MTSIKIFTDGGSRGNPGPSAAAFAAFVGGRKIDEKSKYLGVTTNNVAEYSAVIIALFWLKNNAKKFDKISFYLDSQLIVRQLNGEYKVKDEKLKELHNLVVNSIKLINAKFEFVHIRRNENKWVDSLVNKTLDENMR